MKKEVTEIKRSIYFKMKFAFSFVFLLSFFLNLQVNQVYGQTIGYDSVSNAKLQFLKQSIKQDYCHTQEWWYGWLGAYSAATIGQGVVYFVSGDKSTRQDMALGAATTLLGAAGQFISPFYPNNEFNEFNSLPETSDEDKLQKLASAERLLNHWSERERMALTWQNHILCTAVNLGGGLITWLAFEDKFGHKRTIWDGIANFALNEVITEAQIWSQPTLAKRKYKKYCQMYLNGNEAYSYVPEMTWYFEAMPGGIGIKIKF
jgi:hypothetical protein